MVYRGYREYVPGYGHLNTCPGGLESITEACPGGGGGGGGGGDGWNKTQVCSNKTKACPGGHL